MFSEQVLKQKKPAERVFLMGAELLLLAVHERLHILAGLEGGNAGSFNLDGLAGARIAAGTGGTGAHFKGAKADKYDFAVLAASALVISALEDTVSINSVLFMIHFLS